MERKRYAIYRLTSPSGRAYVGFTGQRISVRWGQHIRRAMRGAKHPLSEAIRKYGSARFSVETLSEHTSIDEALMAEAREIARLEKPYNLSPGGELDGAAGVKKLAELLQNPDWRAAYRAALSAGVRKSAASRAHLAALAALARQWRSANPAKAYKMSVRSLRIGRNSGKIKTKNETSQRLRRKTKSPSAKKARSMRSREAAKQHWAKMPADKKNTVCGKISKSLAQHHAGMSRAERKKHETQLSEARKSIDHALRKKRQKEALVAYWTPERRAEFGERVRARRRGENDANV